MDISQILNNAYQKLKNHNTTSASLDAEFLLSHILRQPREYILAHPEIKLTKKQITEYSNLIKQRAQHVPLAYLIKTKEFYGRPFYVDERVLVPRPETEIMIDAAVAHCHTLLQNNKQIAVADIGTGSGCIIITFAKELQTKKNIKFLATDISHDALAVARKNARRHGVDKKIKFLQGNLLEPLQKYPISNIPTLPAGRQYLIITANLPYLTTTEIKQSPTIKYEPKLALSAGKDGLKYYRELAEQLQGFRNISIYLCAEIGPAQGAAMKKIFSFAKKIEIKKDLAGRDRVAVMKF